jgi:hypothetical protein
MLHSAHGRKCDPTSEQDRDLSDDQVEVTMTQQSLAKGVGDWLLIESLKSRPKLTALLCRCGAPIDLHNCSKCESANRYR